MWFQTIGLEIDLKIKRLIFYISVGIFRNIISVDFLHVQNRLIKVLKYNGEDKNTEKCLLALQDFQNWFHGDGNILGYLSNIIAEYLNNIRWGIHRYLKSQFNGARFCQSPEVISNSCIKSCYDELMYIARKEPYMPEFYNFGTF